ncbi:glycosyltransferase family 4 protein [Flavobacterium cheonhonense]|uniref:Glycosyltransferase family 4 protein n=1 Tax=Flavobacterium cheonhonense TaxID=706185 RepID=A0ABP7TQL1_9FLAO|nr:glycosyltransferase family 4 protein [Flavobacterium cheonhonense]
MNKKLIVGITAPGSVILIAGQLRYFKDLGYQTYLMAPNHERVVDYCRNEGCVHLPVDLEREISLLKDLKALYQVIRHLRKVKPDVVNFGTPKVSLLGMIAAKLLGVKNRIYTCRGFRFEHETGMKKAILVGMEKITARFAHKIICISNSVRELGLDNGIFSAAQSLVIHKGSSNGIDLERFNPNQINAADSADLRKQLGNDESHFVFGFVGRLIDRKGIKELYEAFANLYRDNDKLKLLIVGPVEESQISDLSLISNMQQHPGILLVGTQSNVPLYLSVMDVFCLPAWWEGFGNVSVQAAAMGLPVIATDVTGSKDAVSKDYNGLLVMPKSVSALQNAMYLLYQNEEKRQELGRNGVVWATNFDSKMIWNEMDALYKLK